MALIARRRVAILAARNGTAKPSVEIIARLEQLNARIKHHAPLVTQEQINYLEAAVATREELAAKRKARGERWGI
ncbi:hypothetical protein [Pseudoxanthomonas indica]|uniref:hypothetical protein n=1 Tax=Pseudoxanthomonas indica TaxID=428993 RepID=UPI0016696FD6|nr:hypothetical protein [Pseudoxanthomonas indica]